MDTGQHLRVHGTAGASRRCTGEGSTARGRNSGAVDGETDKKEEGKASVSTAPKTNKASPAFNIVDLHMPSMWPSAAVDTHREMVIKDYQKCILTFLFSFKKNKKKCDYLLSLLFLHF